MSDEKQKSEKPKPKPEAKKKRKRREPEFYVTTQINGTPGVSEPTNLEVVSPKMSDTGECERWLRSNYGGTTGEGPFAIVQVKRRDLTPTVKTKETVTF